MPQLNRCDDTARSGMACPENVQPAQNPLPFLLRKRPVLQVGENPRANQRRVVHGQSAEVGGVRPWLEEYEKYATSITPEDPRIDIARDMLDQIAMAKAALKPSRIPRASGANHHDIVGRLALLRERAERVMHVRRPRNLPRGQSFPCF